MKVQNHSRYFQQRHLIEEIVYTSVGRANEGIGKQPEVSKSRSHYDP